MSVKKQLLEMLENHRDAYISGQELADRLSVTRGAIWKAIRKLEQEGHKISGVNNKGYRLESNSDMITAEGIHHHLSATNKQIPILAYKTLGSTNTQARMLPEEGAGDVRVLVANEQTQGKGRLGRSFYSPADSGIYMSILLRPDRHINELALITMKISVAVCRVIETFKEVEAQIKWVNDIYLNGRKVGGILTEAVTDFESGMVETLVIGIGLNISTREEDFPQEICQVAGSVFPVGVTRNQIVARLIDEVLEVYRDEEKGAIMDEYRRRCFLLGREIRYTIKGETFEGRALDVNDAGHLIVESGLGGHVVLNSGEVSLRSKPQ